MFARVLFATKLELVKKEKKVICFYWSKEQLLQLCIYGAGCISDDGCGALSFDLNEHASVRRIYIPRVLLFIN